MGLKKVTIDILIDQDVSTEEVLESIQRGFSSINFENMNRIVFSFNKMDCVYYPTEDKFVCPITLNMENLNEQDAKQESQRNGTSSGPVEKAQS